jgi:hypothetical protein
MPADCSTGELFGDSLTLYDHCIEAGLMQAGYHALAAAMLCADAASSRKAIDLVIELAHQRQQAIDAECPPHRLSTAEARAGGATPLFEGLATTAKAIRTRLKRAGFRAGARRAADIPG